MNRLNRNNNIKQNRMFFALICIVLCGIIIAAVSSSLDRPTKHSAEPEKVYGIPVYTDYISKDLPCRPGGLRKIKYIVIHETANTSKGANAKNHAAYLKEGGAGNVSWHYTVDEMEIYHHIPDNEVAWHAGERDGNEHGIGIELCVNSDGDFSKTFENGARLTAYLLEAYDLKIDDIKQHYDFTGKNCPMNIREDERWDEFLERVEYYLNLE